MNEIWRQWEGQVVNGQFPLQKYLGGSGHGIVFLTERSGPGSERAALKLVLDDPAQGDARLAAWAQTKSISHPNLLQVFDAGRCRLGETALLYVVMEHADEDLSQLLPQRALAPAEAEEMLPPIVKALAYLHGRGFVHGHLKPANIMAIGNDVKLSSDGLCVLAGTSRVWADHPGMDVFDPVYDPPEAEGGVLTPAADVWSLGVTLVEALTLRRRIWDKTERGGRTGPDLILPPGIPVPFLDVVQHCLIPDPTQRWTSAEIVARLESPAGAQAAEPAQRRGTSGTGNQAPGAGTKPGAAKWLYPAIAVLGIILVGVVIAKVRHPALSDQDKFSQTRAQPAQAPVQSDPGQSATSKAEAPPSQPPSPSASSSASPVNTSATSAAAGAVLHQVVPEVSAQARNTIEGHIRVSVRVAVDPAGNVTQANYESRGPSPYFAHLALQSAQGWKFAPPQVNGQKVPSEWVLRYAFSRGGTDVHPARIGK